MDKHDYSRITPGVNALTKNSNAIPTSILSSTASTMSSAACATSPGAVSSPG